MNSISKYIDSHPAQRSENIHNIDIKRTRFSMHFMNNINILIYDY